MTPLAVIGADEDHPLLRVVEEALVEHGYDVERTEVGSEWPTVGHAVANAVASGRAALGVVCCYTGTGVSIAANKVAGVRAALCTDRATAEGARRWNDANVLALSLRLTSAEVAREIVDAFVATAPEASELPRIARVEQVAPMKPHIQESHAIRADEHAAR
jgi:ribose 5-phosphate isomerase B